jgi:lysozyme
MKLSNFKSILRTASVVFGAIIIGLSLSRSADAIAESKGIYIGAYPIYSSYGITLPSEFEVHGIDVSRHQKSINWEAVSKVKHDGVALSFAFIKASEGMTITDDYFKHNWKEAKKHGMLRGAYHFYRPHLGADIQANLFFSQLPKLDKGDLPPVLDIELKGSTDVRTLRKNLKRWLVLVENRYGVKPIIYTSYHFYKTYLNTSDFNKYPLWIAHYKASNLYEKMDGWHFWQHTDRGLVNGIHGPVDFNVFKGNVEELQNFCKN